MKKKLTDKDRLDWLTKRKAQVTPYPKAFDGLGGYYCHANKPHFWATGKSPRAAIDAAIRSESKLAK